MPFGRLLVVLGHSIAFCVNMRQIRLSMDISLFGCLSYTISPPLRNSWRSGAVRTHPSQTVLSLRISLISRFSIPLHCLFLIPDNPQAVLVHPAQIILSNGISLICSFSGPILLPHAHPWGLQVLAQASDLTSIETQRRLAQQLGETILPLPGLSYIR